MAAPLYGNQLLTTQASDLKSYLNVGVKHLRLFKNSFLPTPASLLSDFQECTFTGYSAKLLSNIFGNPTKVQDGQYQIDSGLQTFSCTGGLSQAIWGWYVDDGTFLLAAQVFASATTIVSGGVFSFSLRPQIISQSIL